MNDIQQYRFIKKISEYKSYTIGEMLNKLHTCSLYIRLTR
jgi:hypothetical protein